MERDDPRSLRFNGPGQTGGQSRVARISPIGVPFGIVFNLESGKNGSARAHSLMRNKQAHLDLINPLLVTGKTIQQALSRCGRGPSGGDRQEPPQKAEKKMFDPSTQHPAIMTLT